jgi:hypothetical protein
MVKSKLTGAQRTELLRLYLSGDKGGAQALALSLGVSQYYATILSNKATDLKARRKAGEDPRRDAAKWRKARTVGPVIA